MNAIEVKEIPVPKQLEAVLDALHDSYGKDDVQTVRGGTQVGLGNCPFKTVLNFVRSLPVKPKGIWSVRIKKGGFHVEHNHPEGTISGVYYVRTGAGGEFSVCGGKITPKPGMLLLFNSALPHSTMPFLGDGTRLTVAFDV